MLIKKSILLISRLLLYKFQLSLLGVFPSFVIYLFNFSLGKNDPKRTASKHSQNLAKLFKKKKLSVPTSINLTMSVSVVPVPVVENPITSTSALTVVEIWLLRKCLLLS